MKRFIALTLMILMILIIITLDSGFSAVAYFINMPSLILIVFIVFPMLILSDQLSDFFRGFKFLMTNMEITNKELKASENAIRLAIKLVYLSGVFGVITGVVLILGRLDDLSALGPALAVAILTFFYAIIINLFLHAIQGKLRKERIYRS